MKLLLTACSSRWGMRRTGWLQHYNCRSARLDKLRTSRPASGVPVEAQRMHRCSGEHTSGGQRSTQPRLTDAAWQTHPAHRRREARKRMPLCNTNSQPTVGAVWSWRQLARTHHKPRPLLALVALDALHHLAVGLQGQGCVEQGVSFYAWLTSKRLGHLPWNRLLGSLDSAGDNQRRGSACSSGSSSRHPVGHARNGPSLLPDPKLPFYPSVVFSKLEYEEDRCERVKSH